jgi:dimethylamine/trimethylamine dehydrogenase
VVVYDDDGFYMGGVIAEAIRSAGHDVTLVTGDGTVSSYAHGTLDQPRIQTRTIELGITILASHVVSAVDKDEVTVACAYSGAERKLACGTLINVTSRAPKDSLYLGLCERRSQFDEAGILSVERIGDCEAPNLIAAAVHAGHLYARTFDGDDDVGRDRVVL